MCESSFAEVTLWCKPIFLRTSGTGRGWESSQQGQRSAGWDIHPAHAKTTMCVWALEGVRTAYSLRGQGFGDASEDSARAAQRHLSHSAWSQNPARPRAVLSMNIRHALCAYATALTVTVAASQDVLTGTREDPMMPIERLLESAWRCQS